VEKLTQKYLRSVLEITPAGEINRKVYSIVIIPFRIFTTAYSLSLVEATNLFGGGFC
jgi:hypothetical protein